MGPQQIGVSPTVFQAAIRALFELKHLHVMVLSFGVSLVIVLSVLLLWKHTKEGRL